MHSILRLFFLAIAAFWSIGVQGAAYMKFDGIDGSVANNDQFPRLGDPYTDVNDFFVKSWSTSGDADDRPTEEVAFYYTPLNGQSPTMLPDGSWLIDTTFNFNYSVDLRRGSGPFTTHTGTGTAHVVGSAPAGPGPREFDMEMLTFDISGVYNGVSPFLIRESPTLASTGRTTIETLPSGQYRIDSFFDVFTEMSVNSGATWFPMVPEPSALMLSVLATFGLGAYQRRR
jgi:hypothetical protein